MNFLNVVKSRVFNNYFFFSFIYFVRKKIIKFSCTINKKRKIKYKIDKNIGFLKLNLNDNNIFEAINYCKKIKLFNFSEKNKKKDFFLFTKKIDIFQNKPILNLAKNEKIISIIENYLNTIPILFYAGIWHSRAEQSHEYKGSQLFHFDREDSHQVKLFIPLEPILDDSGPLNVFDVKSTSYFVKKNLINLNFINKKDRFLDNHVKNILKIKPKILTAEVGDLIFVDTTNCLHFGSRDCKLGKYHLTLQYLTPYSTKLGSFIKENKKIDSIFSYLKWKKAKEKLENV